MIAWLFVSLPQAHAQSAADCLNDDSYPLAGTSGYENGLSALRINAATYNATAFAERVIFPTAIEAMKQDEALAERLEDGEIDEDEQAEMNETSRETGLGTQGALGPTQRGPFAGWDPGGAIVYEVNQTFGVARVPVWQVGADCPADLRIASRPMDLTSANIGAAGRYGRVGFFFSSAIIYGNLGESSNQTRVGLGFVMPFIATSSLMAAPFSQGAQVIQGSTAWATDFIGGGTVDLELMEVRAGYTASDGWYFSAGEERVGLFGYAVTDNDFSRSDQFAGGAKRVRWGKASDKGVGRTSAFARQVPVTEPDGEDDGEEGLVDTLLTGHFSQEGIAQALDLGFGYAVEPVPQLYDVEVAFHSANFHDPEAGGTYWFIGGGMVQLPARPYYGIEGGQFVAVRGAIVSPFKMNGRDAGRFTLTTMFNDEEQLALFPFATNALSWRINITGRL